MTWGLLFGVGVFIIIVFIADVTSTWLPVTGRTLYQEAGAVLHGRTMSY